MGCVLVSFFVLVVILVLILVVSQSDVDEKMMSSTTSPKKDKFSSSLPGELQNKPQRTTKFQLENQINLPLEIRAS